MTKGTLYQRLLAVKSQVEYLQKEAQGFGFKYTPSSQVIGSVRQAMNEQGVLLVPRVVKVEVADHLTDKGKTWKFTAMTMTFTWVNVDFPEETIECPWYAQGLDDAEKGVGKALTYAEKYFLLKFFNIPTDKDDPDAWMPKSEGKPKAPTPKDKDAPKADNPAPSDTPAQAQAREQVRAWLLEDCDGSDERISSRLTDLVGHMVASPAELTIPELRAVWKTVSNGRGGKVE